jgi:hypothetical protein
MPPNNGMKLQGGPELVGESGCSQGRLAAYA